MNVYLNTFAPICANKFGRNSVTENNLPHFIDGSCRREPDFENPFPAITQLCRPGKLVTRLKLRDIIIYLTKKGNYGNDYPHWRFIAILEVIDIYPNHQSAARSYLNNNIQTSQNIFCDKTNPFNLNMTHGICGFKHRNLSSTHIIHIWNEFYKKRSIDFSKCAKTKVWQEHLYLENPDVITHETMMEIFNRIPGTQTPPKLTDAEWSNFRRIMNV
jgi:hypothetical protein